MSSHSEYPGPRARGTIAALKRLEGAGTRIFAAGGPPLVLQSAQGVWFEDPDGNRYLDLFGGYAVANIGHSHPKVVQALCRQAGELIHCPSALGNPVRAGLLEKLARIAPPGLERILFGLTGSQANEIALNLATTKTGRREIIAFQGGYFGRSNAMTALAGKTRVRDRLGLAPGAHFIPYPYCYRCALGGCEDAAHCKILDLLDDMLANPASGVGPVAAVMAEPILGSGGVVVPPNPFFRDLQAVCRRHDVLLVLDEIQVGFGRTGRMWASEHCGIVPDLMTIGKGIGGGLPLSAVLGRETLMNFWEPDTYTTTFLTNALIHAAAGAAIEVMLAEKLWHNSARLGEWWLTELRTALADHPRVGDIRGRGLFIGIEMVADRKAKTPAARDCQTIQARARAAGLVVGVAGNYGNVLRLCPPLSIQRSEVETAHEKLITIFETLP